MLAILVIAFNNAWFAISGGTHNEWVGHALRFFFGVNPSDPSNRVIDMRHFMVLGERNRVVGDYVTEFIQRMSGDDPNHPSAWDPQDRFSNQLGREFFYNYDPKGESFSKQLGDYFKGREDLLK